MKTFAPELSALITIFRSTGPVISTRRSTMSAGIDAQVQSPSRIARGLRQEIGQRPAIEFGLPLRATGHEVGAATAERPLELGRERDRVGRQDLGELRRNAAR